MPLPARLHNRAQPNTLALAHITLANILNGFIQQHPAAPSVERCCVGEVLDFAAIGPHGATRQGAAGFVGQILHTSGHHQTGGEAFEIPFERAGNGLVEIIGVKQRLTRQPGHCAEIGQMRVAAELDDDAAMHVRTDIRRHHRGGAAQKCKRISHHPAIAYWQ